MMTVRSERPVAADAGCWTARAGGLAALEGGAG